jgi:hypothetical protein
MDDHLRVRSAQVLLVPVITRNLLDLGDVQLAVLERNAMRPVEVLKHGDDALRLARPIRRGKSQHGPVVGRGRQQHTARAPRHHPRMVLAVGEYRYLEPGRGREFVHVHLGAGDPLDKKEGKQQDVRRSHGVLRCSIH